MSLKNYLRLAFAFASTLPAFGEPLVTKPDLSEFEVKGQEGCWTFENSVLTGKSAENKKGSVLWTKTKYKDFTIEGDFRFSGSIDSGFFLRSEVDQIQLGVSRSLKRDMTGSPYIGKTGKYPVEAKSAGTFKEGEWNHFVITAKGNHYVVTFNGTQVLDYHSETAIEEGPIGFQVHPGVEMKVEFRNLDVKAEAAEK